MAWVRFTRAWEWRVPDALARISYRVGRAYSVKADVAAQAIASGAAKRMASPKKGVDPNEAGDGADA